MRSHACRSCWHPSPCHRCRRHCSRCRQRCHCCRRRYFHCRHCRHCHHCRYRHCRCSRQAWLGRWTRQCLRRNRENRGDRGLWSAPVPALLSGPASNNEP
ncbi:hypothetical protein FJ944_05575 [Mesorhizobium sp. B2-4-11]|nr:hypothetical protein FJ944_05575 [Mesorhizobium sp. B2-4-11]